MTIFDALCTFATQIIFEPWSSLVKENVNSWSRVHNTGVKVFFADASNLTSIVVPEKVVADLGTFILGTHC